MTEFGFIDSIRRLFAELPDNGFEGIGDDCAVLPLGDGTSLLFTADLLTEGVHFLRAATSARELGRKSLAVNLSDIAAMGARPVATLLSLALPADAEDAWTAEFTEGYRELSARYGAALVGGDTTRSAGGITINVTAIGRAPDAHVKRRDAAREGDIVFVAGELGASGAQPCTLPDLRTAACGGEDYKLLLTADPSAADRLAADYLARFGSPLYPLGRITARPGLVWLRDGRPEPLDWHGFEHF